MNKPPSSCLDPFEEGAITVAAAVEQILEASSRPQRFEKLALRECLGRCLYEDVISPLAVPAHNNSAMDGYALNSHGLDGAGAKQFRVVGDAYAGKPYSGSIAQGECVRIMTGAVMPAQTDSVLIQEQVNLIDGQTIETSAAIRPQQNVRFAGEDIQAGAAVLARGAVIKPADLGIIASLGISECKVYRKPRVSFFSTGDELKSIGEPLGAGDIYDSNRYSLFGLLSASGVDIIDMGVVRDDPDSLREALQVAAASSDVVLTSGGVSVGEADYIKDILQQIGDMALWKILMKPG
ncbi:MAG: molybdopterin molybdotransferase MoeA, partial [Gammaproteobacteria bacterium]|nr:molybdopterin molybdotransferase MoeA [Gammaproteobacteria bacterium]